jgi:hypothetical protein
MALVPFSMIGFSGAYRPARRSGVGVTGPAADLLDGHTRVVHQADECVSQLARRPFAGDLSRFTTALNSEPGCYAETCLLAIISSSSAARDQVARPCSSAAHLLSLDQLPAQV